MNRLWCSLSQMLRRCGATAAPQRLLHWCSSAPRVTPSTVLPRRFRWYHDPRKATAATAIGLGAAALAACEVVPCTNRCHLVVYSRQGERDLGESLFAAELKSIHRHRMVDPHHPDSIRVRLIAERIIHAAKRGLGIYDSRDAPLLRVTRKGKKPWAPQPHTRHLHGLNGSWELVLARHTSANAMSAPGGKLLVFTGLLDYFKTDGEIAFALAHELLVFTGLLDCFKTDGEIAFILAPELPGLS
uniref:Peptidase M48 domain-containing protein n=1 Tax=Aegilops tauschii TaxID=37682 RepID=N1QWR1_AEGTA